MSRGWALLVGMFLVGCSGATPGVRHVPGQQERCIYAPRRDIALGVLNEKVRSARPGVEVVPVGATLGASTAAPQVSVSAPLMEGLSGEGLGSGVPRGVLRLVPEGSTAAEGVGTGGAAAELVVTGGAVVAAAGSVFLVCLTVSAAADVTETPIDVADEFYGTHFGDVSGWVQGQTPATKASKSERDKGVKKGRGRIYVTYTKFNKNTHRYYSGRTSMVVDLTKPLEGQAYLAVILRDVNHHIDESIEPSGDAFDFGNIDEFDVGAAVDYAKRYDDVAYWRIRGREQQLIDSHGGAWSDTGKPYQTENAVRGVAKGNPWGRRFHDAAAELWGQLYPYTGY